MDRRQLVRDGLLATATGVALLLGSLALGVGRDALTDPIIAGVGCAGMAGIEVLLLRNPDLTRRLWARRAVRVASALGVLVGGGFAVWVGAAWVGSLLVWGLAAYVALVGAVLVSGRNPLARFG